ncbi:uncharacterized protein LOC128883056 [Hylaeus volcanicus]|uniref:uncharacterized protein LOC128883056 n=1 Tax=Hylaeus volcanicus TaxID=313075 RepID=UPI0023B87F5D|nr:uncharacterized protein LOC128883056 [Hylaeus volcanicus]
MTKIVRDKFIRHSDLREKLKDTGTRPLIWLNSEDDFFGIVGEKGLNHLGQILMDTRRDIHNSKDLQAWIATNIPIETEPQQRPDVTLLEYKPPNLTVIEETHILDPNYQYWLVGKFATHHIRPLNPTVSRNHAVLVIDDAGNVLIVDLKSKLGTYVNDEKIENPYVPYNLLEGDALKFASSNRIYIVKIDKTRIMKYLQKKCNALSTEITQMSNVLYDSTKSSKSQETKILVRNLNYTTTTTDISDFFSSYGEIQDIKLPLNEKRNFKSNLVPNKGFCIIHFRDPKAASASFAKNGAFLNKRHIKIEYYVEKPLTTFESQPSSNKRPFAKRQETNGVKEANFGTQRKTQTTHFHNSNKSYIHNDAGNRPTQTPALNSPHFLDKGPSHSPLESRLSRKRSRFRTPDSYHHQHNRTSFSERSLDSSHR